MKIFEILNLEEIPISYISNTLHENCSEILNFYKKYKLFLYHGSHIRKDFEIMPPIKNRYPKDTLNWIHNNINSHLKSLGFIATRENSMFCTGSLLRSKTFGPTYYVFPFDNFNYTWSRTITDFYTQYGIGHSIYPEAKITSMSDDDFLKATNYEQGNSKTTENLLNAVTSHNEIMINGYIYLLNHDKYKSQINKIIS